MSGKMTYFGAIKFLKKYILKYKQHFLLFYIGFLFDLVLQILLPILFGIMIDQIVYRGNQTMFLTLSGVYIVTACISCGLYFLIYAQHHYLFSMYTLDIKLDIYRHLIKMDSPYRTGQSTGNLMALLNQDSSACVHFMIRNVIHFINGFLEIVLLLFYLFKIDWRIGLFSAIAAPLSVAITIRYGEKIRRYEAASRAVYGTYVSWIHEMLSAMKDLRLLCAQSHVGKQFAAYHEELFCAERKSGFSSMTANNLVQGVNLFIRLSIYGLVAFLAGKGSITIGLLTVILSFYGKLTSMIQRVSSQYLDSQKRVAAIERIYRFLQSPLEKEADRTEELVITNGEISIEKLCFSYEKGQPIYQDFHLTIQSGERVALTGESGSGKTTLAYLLLGFYQAQSGIIRIDGHDLSKCTLKSIRSQLGLVAQDVFLIPGTIAENICLGNRHASKKQLESVCRQAGLWDFVLTLPNGLDTVIGSCGRELSGGQKQRIAIARIYLKNPKILIFDEATSALDSDTEAQIHKAWESVLQNKTVLVISHRPSSLALCHCVVNVKGGSHVY